MATMRSPKGLELVESCLNCKLRFERLFCNLEGKALEELDRLKYSTSFPLGAVVFSQGQSPQGVNIICQGRVKLSMTAPDGRILTIKMAEEGEILGLSATITGKAHDITAETETPCQLNFIRRDDFLRFLKSNHDVCFHAAQELSQLHSAICSGLRLFGLAPSVGARLAMLLLKMDAENTDSRRGQVKCPYTHEEIAHQLGASRETVTRLLLDLRKKKILEIRGTVVVIRNRAVIEQMASGITFDK